MAAPDARGVVDETLDGAPLHAVEVYSPFRIPSERIRPVPRHTKLVIDPLRPYFENEVAADAARFERLVLIHGCEPPESNDIADLVVANASSFSRIHSFDRRVLSSCPGSELFCFGSCWVVDQDDRTKPFPAAEKAFEVSFVKSDKLAMPGHWFRQEIARVLERPRAFHLNYPRQWIPEKHPLFERAMFHVAAENSRHENYFTEKIVDCFVSATLPIYWGCPNIGDYFDADGILTFETADELAAILDGLTPEDFHDRFASVERNRSIAMREYAFFFDRVNEILRVAQA